LSKLKISADTTKVKKSILDLNKELKNLGKSKVSIFNAHDRKFIKNELNKELSTMKAKLTENRKEISNLVKEQAKLEKGTKEELENRKKILTAYRTQTRLAREMGQLQSSGQGGGGGPLSGLLGRGASMLGAGALALGGYGILRGYQASSQFVGGAQNRVRLRGLGVSGDTFGSPEELARAGLNEQDLIQRRIRATSRLGRSGSSQQSIMQQAMFERAFGLEGGAMTNISTSLRGQFGGRGADEAQMRLQASVLATGMEDAIGPYLEAATELLADINKNGMSNTDEMIRLFGQLSADNQRTPEQIAQAFTGINSAVMGATGEQSAFLQTAFARGGIGGGTIGATRLAMESGGIMGLSRKELESRGYNAQLLDQMEGAGFFGGAGQRTGAILDQFKRSAGLGMGQRIGDITDVNTMTGLSHLANPILGTQGLQGFDALKLMEKVQTKQLSTEEFDKQLESMREKKNPTVDRLETINNTLAGQTTILTDMKSIAMGRLGLETVQVRNVAVEGDIAGIRGTANVAGTVNRTGVTGAARKGVRQGGKALFEGGIGEAFYEWLNGSPEEENQRLLQQGAENFRKKRANSPQGPGTNTSSLDPATQEESLAKAVERGVTRGMAAQRAQNINNNNVNVQIRNSDGSVKESTHK